MAKAESYAESIRTQGLAALLAQGRKAAPIAAQEGLMLATLPFAEPTALSLCWGAFFTFSGLAILIWERGYSEKPPVVTGPYRFVRNPLSLAQWFLTFGAATASLSFPAVLLALVILPWLYYLDHESAQDQADSGLEAVRYRHHVPALIPTLLPFKASPHGGFSWRKAIRLKSLLEPAKFFCFLLIWVYALATFNFKLPWWAGFIAAAIWIAIKLFFSRGKIASLGFRKNP